MIERSEYGERFYGSFLGISPFDRVIDHVTVPDMRPVYVAGTAGVRYDVTIYERGYAGASTEVAFDADRPLVIEWNDVRPEDVVEGSTATLRVISPGDRSLLPLYTVDPLGVMLEVKRAGKLVWRGTLEPELYTEPYSEREGYTVELTFADFAPMEREEFDLKKFQTFAAILTRGLDATVFGISHGGASLPSLDRISLKKLVGQDSGAEWETVSLGDFSISADNFYDEDGEAMTLREAVETILRPLALHLRQHGGRAVLYDWNALATGEATAETVWTSTDQTLGVAEVSHAVTLRYSTYASETLVDGEIDPDELTGDAGSVTTYIDPKLNAWGQPEADSIRGFTCDKVNDYDPKKALPPGMDAQGNALFKITSYYSGSDKAGILGIARTEQDSDGITGVGCFDIYYDKNNNGIFFDYDQPLALPTVMQLTTPFYPSMGDSVSHQIKVSLEVMVDARNNPYEEAADGWNEIGDAKRLKERANFGYIPVALEALDAAGNIIAHYSNREAFLGNHRYEAMQEGVWQSGYANQGDMFLAWYDWKDRKKSSGWGSGWATNRQLIGNYSGSLPSIYEKRGDGEFISFAGTHTLANIGKTRALRLTVYAGLHHFSDHRQQKEGFQGTDKINWMLYGEAKVEIGLRNGRKGEAEDEVYTAEAIAGAASEVEVDIKAGPAVACPTARAVVTGPDLSRGGRSGDILELLCNTLVSQYDRPHLLLKGEHRADIVLDPAGVPVLTDAAQGAEKRFIVTAAAVDCRAGTADVTLREISPDSYHPVIKA